MTKPRDHRAINNERPNEREPERAAISLGESSAFNLPPSFLEKHPDKSYAFVPYLCGGVEMKDDYYDAVHDRHFEPVLASSHPELNRRMALSPFKSQEEDDFIKVKGQILMQRSKDDQEAEIKKYDESAARQQYLLSLHRMNPQNPDIFVDDRKWGGRG